MNNPSFVRLLWQSQRPLLGKLLCYNDVLDDIHDDHLSALFPPQILKFLIKTSFDNRKIFKILRQRLGVKPVPLTWFQNEPYRLLLFPGEDIMRLLKYVGSILNLEGIKKTVHRPAREELKKYLGEEVYTFALKRSPLYRPFFKNISIPTNYKTVYTMESIQNTGKYCIECCFAAASNEILARFLLKFPASSKWNFSHAVDFETKNYVFSLLKRLLSKEMHHPLATCL